MLKGSVTDHSFLEKLKMLNIKKFNYFSMIDFYIKLMPKLVALKIIIHIIKSIIPLANTLITAIFLDTVITINNDTNNVNKVLFFMFLSIIVNLIFHYLCTFEDLINNYVNDKIKLSVNPKLLKRVSVIKPKFRDHEPSVGLIKRVIDNFEDILPDYLESILIIWDIVVQLAGIIWVLGTHFWWAALVYFIVCIPSVWVSVSYGKNKYHTSKELWHIKRKAEYIAEILTNNDAVEERYLFGYTLNMNNEYKNTYNYGQMYYEKNETIYHIKKWLSGFLGIFGIVLVAFILLSSDSYSNGALSIGMFIAVIKALINFCTLIQDKVITCVLTINYRIEYLNDLQCKGVHSEVSKEDAIQCIIQTYICLGDILSLQD